MRIIKAELRRVCIPFKRRFDHATATRDSAERVYVTLESARGEIGFGEIMPRPYLTGETMDEVFETTGPARAADLIGQRFENPGVLVAHLKASLRDAERRLALAAGFEAALINLAEQAFGGFDYGTILGSKRATPIGRCVTIGLVDDERTLRRYALEAKMAKATVVKVKVGAEEDVERVRRLRGFLGALPLRLDANGGLSFETTKTLLADLKRDIQSIEQPLSPAEPDLDLKLQALFADHGVPIMADESACSAADIDAWHGGFGYQLVNIRVGKCGGLIGAKAAIDAARRQGLGIVGGALVGESGPLDRQGSILLEYTEDMPYMEGLGQARWLLAGDPTRPFDCNDYERSCRLKWNANQLERWQIGHEVVFS